eukprot:Gregarina_sp_Poly_1__10648@NODE_7_length_24424_cov_76_286365_g6_i0_p17_GENE_NODE_7_length_24424_cov_76_286365_g6_i0NODE_7_length_24424_cov_76_286365_g6_i0_p17_ORF_typecomplete_len135_score13_10_NODE_7_length_24424_cov_76_286365_g6_i072067610
MLIRCMKGFVKCVPIRCRLDSSSLVFACSCRLRCVLLMSRKSNRCFCAVDHFPLELGKDCRLSKITWDSMVLKYVSKMSGLTSTVSSASSSTSEASKSNLSIDKLSAFSCLGSAFSEMDSLVSVSGPPISSDVP